MNDKLTNRKFSLTLAGESAALAAGAIIFLVFIATAVDTSLIHDGQQAAVVTSVLVDLGNQDRKEAGLPALLVNEALTRAAQAKANDMAEKGYFAHTSPEGKTPWYWIREAGYPFSRAGENLAVDFSDAEDVEKAWMASPTHRANLLNSGYTEIGIATARGTYKGHTVTFVAEEFGTPAQKGAVAAPTEAAPPPPKHTEVPTVLGAATAPQSEDAVSAVPEPLPAASPVARAVATPRTTLSYTYLLIGFVIVAALLIRTRLEITRGHVRHAAVALLLLALMGSLAIAADRYLFAAPSLAEAAAVGGV